MATSNQGEFGTCSGVTIAKHIAKQAQTKYEVAVNVEHVIQIVQTTCSCWNGGNVGELCQQWNEKSGVVWIADMDNKWRYRFKIRFEKLTNIEQAYMHSKKTTASPGLTAVIRTSPGSTTLHAVLVDYPYEPENGILAMRGVNSWGTHKSYLTVDKENFAFAYAIELQVLEKRGKSNTPLQLPELTRGYKETNSGWPSLVLTLTGGTQPPKKVHVPKNVELSNVIAEYAQNINIDPQQISFEVRSETGLLVDNIGINSSETPMSLQLGNQDIVIQNSSIVSSSSSSSTHKSKRQKTETIHPFQWLFEGGYTWWNGTAQYRHMNAHRCQSMIEASAFAGFPMAEVYCHLNGWNGLKKDEKKAFEMCVTINESNEYSFAQYQLGECYEEAKGTAEDMNKSFKWYYKSAVQGNCAAMNNVGYCYETGEGVEQDQTKAFEWYEKSALMGVRNSMFNVGVWYEEGKGEVTINVDKARQWYARAHAQMHLEAKKALDQLNAQ